MTGYEVVLPAAASGPLLRLAQPLSFWGGVDPATGEIVDRTHPQAGVGVAGTTLLTGATRGSSSSSSTLLECVRRGTAPAILLLTAPDPILVIGAAAAWETYGRGPAVVLLEADPGTPDGTVLRVTASGTLVF